MVSTLPSLGPSVAPVSTSASGAIIQSEILMVRYISYKTRFLMLGGQGEGSWVRGGGVGFGSGFWNKVLEVGNKVAQ